MRIPHRKKHSISLVYFSLVFSSLSLPGSTLVSASHFIRSRQYVSVNGVAQYVSVVILAQAIEGITFPYYSILSSQVSPLPRDVRLPCSINVLGR